MLTFTFHPSVSIEPISFSRSVTPAHTHSTLPSLSNTCRHPHTPVGVMLRCGLLTFPGLAEAFQIVLYTQKRCQGGSGGDGRGKGTGGRRASPQDTNKHTWIRIHKHAKLCVRPVCFHVQMWTCGYPNTHTHTHSPYILQKDPQLSVPHYTVEMSASLKWPIWFNWEAECK